MTTTEKVARILELHKQADVLWDEALDHAKEFMGRGHEWVFPYTAVVELGLPYMVFPPEEGDDWWLSVRLSEDRFASVEIPAEGLAITPKQLADAYPGPAKDDGYAEWVDGLVADGYLLREGDALRAMPVATVKCSHECMDVRRAAAPEGHSWTDVPHIGDCGLVGFDPEAIWARRGQDGRAVAWETV